MRSLLVLCLLVGATACGKSAPKSDCRASVGCKAFGKCSSVADQCVPLTDDECKASESCSGKGDCALVSASEPKNNRCGPARLEDCTASQACTHPKANELGLCTYDPGDRVCLVVGALVCRGSSECSDEGKCTKEQYAPDPSRPHDTSFHCVAKSDGDCEKAKACSEQGRCVARGGECQPKAGGGGGFDKESIRQRLSRAKWTVEDVTDLSEPDVTKFYLYSLKDNYPGSTRLALVSFWDFTLIGKAAHVGPKRAVWVTGGTAEDNAAIVAKLSGCEDAKACVKAFEAAGLTKVVAQPPDKGSPGFALDHAKGERDDVTFDLSVLDYAAAVDGKSEDAAKAMGAYVFVASTDKRDVSTTIVEAASAK